MNLKLNESENDAFIKSKERSEYSCIGLADFLFFFSGKSLYLFTLNFDFSRFDL